MKIKKHALLFELLYGLLYCLVVVGALGYVGYVALIIPYWALQELR